MKGQGKKKVTNEEEGQMDNQMGGVRRTDRAVGGDLAIGSKEIK